MPKRRWMPSKSAAGASASGGGRSPTRRVGFSASAARGRVTAAGASAFPPPLAGTSASSAVARANLKAAGRRTKYANPRHSSVSIDSATGFQNASAFFDTPTTKGRIDRNAETPGSRLSSDGGSSYAASVISAVEAGTPAAAGAAAGPSTSDLRVDTGAATHDDDEGLDDGGFGDEPVHDDEDDDEDNEDADSSDDEDPPQIETPTPKLRDTFATPSEASSAASSRSSRSSAASSRSSPSRSNSNKRFAASPSAEKGDFGDDDDGDMFDDGGFGDDGDVGSGSDVPSPSPMRQKNKQRARTVADAKAPRRYYDHGDLSDDSDVSSDESDNESDFDPHEEEEVEGRSRRGRGRPSKGGRRSSTGSSRRQSRKRRKDFDSDDSDFFSDDFDSSEDEDSRTGAVLNRRDSGFQRMKKASRALPTPSKSRGQRRSTRQRFRVLQHWKGEHLEYERSNDGIGAVLPTVRRVARVGTKTPKPRKRRRRTGADIKKGGAGEGMKEEEEEVVKTPAGLEEKTPLMECQLSSGKKLMVPLHARCDSLDYQELPASADRPEGVQNARAAAAFVDGQIKAGVVELVPGARKDEEYTMNCCQIFHIFKCTPKALQVDIDGSVRCC